MPKTQTKEITAEQLVEVLKFTPRTYRIELGNYGGEVYAGRVDRKVYEYFKANQLDLDEYATNWENELNVPEEFQPFPPGSPYDCDDLVHASGATMDSSNLVQVFDENDDKVWECSLDLNALDNEGIDCNEWESFNGDEMADGDVVYWGAQGEKGLLYGGEINLTSPFDPKKLKLSYADADGWLICNGVEYDGEDISNDDMSTTGKWGENKWLINGEDIYEAVNSEDRAEPEPESACSSESEPEQGFELTEWFPKSVKPVRIGRYETHVNIKPVWPWPAETMLEWTGKNWKDTDGNVIKNVVEWRGVLGPTE